MEIILNGKKHLLEKELSVKELLTSLENVIHCSADLETGNGNPADGRKVKGTIHWVSAAHCVEAEVRLYDIISSGLKNRLSSTSAVSGESEA